MAYSEESVNTLDGLTSPRCFSYAKAVSRAASTVATMRRSYSALNASKVGSFAGSNTPR